MKKYLSMDHKLALVAICLSIVALFQSCGANRTASDANEIASQTYLWVEPVHFPLDGPRQAELAELFGRSFEGMRYMYILSDDQLASILCAVEIRNSGPHAAENVVLHSEVSVFMDKADPESRMTLVTEVPIGDIAPGQTVVHDLVIAMNVEGAPLPPGLGRRFMNTFYNGRIDAELSSYAAFHCQGRSSVSGEYMGSIEHSGLTLDRLPQGEASVFVEPRTVSGQ